MIISGSEIVQEMSIILWPDDNVLVVNGGSPLNLTDGDCVTLVNNNKNYTLQLTSPVKGKYSLKLMSGHWAS